jgi:hypothetical protein
MAFHKWRAADPGFQVLHLLRKFILCIGIGIERIGSQSIRAGRTSHTKIYAARRYRFQYTKLLGDFERRVVRQHDAGAADSYARCGRRDGSHGTSGAVPTMLSLLWCSETQ